MRREPRRCDDDGLREAGCPGKPRVAAAWLAVREMPHQLAGLANPEASESAALPAVDNRAGALASPAADELLVLLRETAPGAEQGALDDWARHPQPRADLAVRQSFQLAQDEDPVMKLRHPPEGAAQVIELLLGLDGDVRARGDREQVVGSAFGLARLVKRHLVAALRPPELVDSTRSGDRADPGLNAIGRSVSRKRRRTEMNTSCDTSSARSASWRIPPT